jgi:hypothetical protein
MYEIIPDLRVLCLEICNMQGLNIFNGKKSRNRFNISIFVSRKKQDDQH